MFINIEQLSSQPSFGAAFLCKMHSADYQCFMVESCRPGNAGIWAKWLCVSVLGCCVLRCSGAQSGTPKAVSRMRDGFFSVKRMLVIIK